MVFPHIHNSARHMEDDIPRQRLHAWTEDEKGDEPTLELHSARFDFGPRGRSRIIPVQDGMALKEAISPYRGLATRKFSPVRQVRP